MGVFLLPAFGDARDGRAIDAEFVREAAVGRRPTVSALAASGQRTTSEALADLRHLFVGHLGARVRASVAALRQARRPIAIGRAVRAVVVSAFERQCWRRPFAHVPQKPLKRCPPCITDGDATATVVREGLVARIEAAIVHPAPGSVLRRPDLAVRRVSRAQGLRQQAAAGPRRAGLEMIGADQNASPAGASTPPHGVFAWWRRQPFQQRQSTTLVTDRQHRAGHCGILHRELPMWARV